MESQRIDKMAVGSIVTLGAIFHLGVFGGSPRVQAQNAPDDYEAALIDEGFKIAPVPLNLAGKDWNLVGLGSYLVNAVGDCNGCHSSGAPPLGLYAYVTGKNPYLKQPAKVEPTVYLAGGANFGTLGIVGTPTPQPNGYAGPAIISRKFDTGQKWASRRRSHACRVHADHKARHRFRPHPSDLYRFAGSYLDYTALAVAELTDAGKLTTLPL